MTTATRAALLRDGATLSAVTLVAVALTALAVLALGLGDDARARFALTLPAPRGTWAHAGDILLNNVRVTVLPLGAALLVARLPVAGRRVLDVVLIAVLALNAALVGAALGAYGWPLARALAPHGLLELAAFAIAGAAYTAARRGMGFAPRRVAAYTGLAWLLLAPAAALEVRRPW
jgi:hypothetical protein